MKMLKQLLITAFLSLGLSSICLAAGAYSPGIVLITYPTATTTNCQADFNVRFNANTPAPGNVFIGGGDGNSIGVFCTDSQTNAQFFCVALAGDPIYSQLEKIVYAPVNGTTISIVKNNTTGKCTQSGTQKQSSKLN